MVIPVGAFAVVVAHRDRPAAAASGPAHTVGALVGNVEPALAALPAGTVGVVAASAPVGGEVALIVRNGTPHRVTDLRVGATMGSPGSREAVRATTRDVIPSVLGPGDLGLARVRFAGYPVAPGVGYHFATRWRRARTPRAVALEATDLRLSPPTPGSVAQSLELTLSNPSRHRLHPPVRVAVMCFGEARRPVQLVVSDVRPAPLEPGAAMAVTMAFTDLCPAYLVGASANRAG